MPTNIKVGLSIVVLVVGVMYIWEVDQAMCNSPGLSLIKRIHGFRHVDIPRNRADP